ncbi:MAG: hypothetical protein AAFQ90_13805, partial [Pseudomonadota bacterium]
LALDRRVKPGNDGGGAADGWCATSVLPDGWCAVAARAPRALAARFATSVRRPLSVIPRLDRGIQRGSYHAL